MCKVLSRSVRCIGIASCSLSRRLVRPMTPILTPSRGAVKSDTRSHIVETETERELTDSIRLHLVLSDSTFWLLGFFYTETLWGNVIELPIRRFIPHNNNLFVRFLFETALCDVYRLSFYIMSASECNTQHSVIKIIITHARRFLLNVYVVLDDYRYFLQDLF